MKSSRFSKNTVKSGLTLLLVSILSTGLTACTHNKHTYSRANVVEAITNLCQKEFSLDVKAWDLPDTLWIYVPLNEPLIDNGDFSSSARAAIHHIFLVLRRVILSIDNRPQFYSLVFSDIKGNGADLYYIGNISDMIKIEANMISLGQWQERELFSYMPNPKAVGDKEGKHIKRYDFTMGELIAGLVRQGLENKFGSGLHKSKFKINAIDAYAFNKKIFISADIEPISQDKGLPVPFDEMKKLLRQFIDLYNFKDIAEIELHDVYNHKHRYYSLSVFMDDSNS